MQKKQQGELAESLARSWLESHDYQFLQCNYYRRVGEIDLIMRHPDQRSIIFAEVRYRADSRYGGGIASVDYRKQAKLIRTANAWLQQHANGRTHARIDVIGISPATDTTPENQLWQAHQIIWVINAIEE